MLPSVTELLQALPSLLSTLTWSSQPQPCYVTSECLTHLIPPSISIPYLPPYKLIPLLLMFWDTAAAQQSCHWAEIWDSPSLTLIGFFGIPHLLHSI